MHSALVVVMSVFTPLTLAIMLLRLAMRKVRHQSFLLGDYLTMLAIVYFCHRTAVVPVILVWGTNNTERVHITGIITPQIRHQLSTASKLSLANRAISMN